MYDFMKVISYLNGSVSRFVSMDEITPEAQAPYASLIPAILERYHFRQQGEGQFANQGIFAPVFQAGEFDINGSLIPILSLEFHPTQINAACATTENAELFLDDLFAFLIESFQYRQVNRKIDQLYTSALVVECEFSLARLFPLATTMANLLQIAMSKNDLQVELQPFAFRYQGSGLLSNGQFLSSFYVLERRAGAPPNTNWQFSQGPFSTLAHVEFLERFEIEFMKAG